MLGDAFDLLAQALHHRAAAGGFVNGVGVAAQPHVLLLQLLRLQGALDALELTVSFVKGDPPLAP